ncbi:ABC transporter ATP-binding protein [Actinobacteria bacterium YIM 96077]|uniref:ABC transporter ATP-binding protein n=1 Tax=Phytoactinopolyspora halophila TaxID=1981511 RepID=A0A329QHC3_9ACTN|nr:ABC transporter ATP-binding protein [Phytoactinopolyspora halophila]AYY14683.1 ABC transporter ATP-binding protein [Actinobacteria bacterium YIM 96077]RAW11606.1 ABC transporter ATP-binding protein [Phytoactinopolyspora halophila]
MKTLEISGLHKQFVDSYTDEVVTAVGDVSFAVEQGEFISVLGPSGCGKTTVLNIVAGFEKQTDGSVLVGGREISGPSPERGVVFQSFALFPWKTVLGNVVFGLRMRGVPRQEREPIARQYLDLVGLEGFERKFPHELSGGMQQRLGVARVLANEPEVMLMDEPFASVDAQTRRKLQEDLTGIFESKRPTVFFVTHDVDEAVFLSDRVVVLSSRPSQVNEIVTVPLERPRDWRSVLDDPDFRHTVTHITDLLSGDESRVVQADLDSA